MKYILGLVFTVTLPIFGLNLDNRMITLSKGSILCDDEKYLNNILLQLTLKNYNKSFELFKSYKVNNVCSEVNTNLSVKVLETKENILKVEFHNFQKWAFSYTKIDDINIKTNTFYEKNKPYTVCNSLKDLRTIFKEGYNNRELFDSNRCTIVFQPYKEVIVLAIPESNIVKIKFLDKFFIDKNGGIDVWYVPARYINLDK